MDEGGLANPDAMSTLAPMQLEAVEPLLDRPSVTRRRRAGELAPWFRDWCDHGDPRDPYFRSISAADHAAEIDLPILHITGWYDYFTKGSLNGYETMARFGASEQARRSQRLIAGPWNHNGLQVRPDADPTTWMFFDFNPAVADHAFLRPSPQGRAA